jgi:chromosome segregation ATPase
MVTSATTRIERLKTPDFLKFLEDVRALKNRVHTIELARLQEQREGACAEASQAAARRARSGAPEDVARLQKEALRLVDADHENSKAMLAAKFEKFESTLEALAHYLRDLTPLRELEARLAQEAEQLKKTDEELRVRRKVVQREEEDLGREKELHRAAELGLRGREADVRAMMANLDVVRRAETLSRLEEDLEGRLKAHEAEAQALALRSADLERDAAEFARRREALDRDAETLRQERESLRREREAMAESVARDLTKAFEGLVLGLLRPPAAKPPEAPPARP